MEHHEDLPTISSIVIEMVLKPSESERWIFQRLHDQLPYLRKPRSFTDLFRTYQEYCDSYGTSAGVQKLEVNGSAYAELAVKLAEYLIERLVSSHPTDFSQAHDSLRFRPPIMRAPWTEDTTNAKFQEDVYDVRPSFSPSPGLFQLLAPKMETYNLHDAISAAQKTLATILPRAARLPALGSLLQHNVFMEPEKDSFFSKEQKDVAIASLKYLQVKLFT